MPITPITVEMAIAADIDNPPLAAFTGGCTEEIGGVEEILGAEATVELHVGRSPLCRVRMARNRPAQTAELVERNPSIVRKVRFYPCVRVARRDDLLRGIPLGSYTACTRRSARPIAGQQAGRNAETSEHCSHRRCEVLAISPVAGGEKEDERPDRVVGIRWGMQRVLEECGLRRCSSMAMAWSYGSVMPDVHCTASERIVSRLARRHRRAGCIGWSTPDNWFRRR